MQSLCRSFATDVERTLIEACLRRDKAFRRCRDGHRGSTSGAEASPQGTFLGRDIEVGVSGTSLPEVSDGGKTLWPR